MINWREFFDSMCLCAAAEAWRYNEMPLPTLKTNTYVFFKRRSHSCSTQEPPREKHRKKRKIKGLIRNFFMKKYVNIICKNEWYRDRKLETFTSSLFCTTLSWFHRRVFLVISWEPNKYRNFGPLFCKSQHSRTSIFFEESFFWCLF